MISSRSRSCSPTLRDLNTLSSPVSLVLFRLTKTRNCVMVYSLHPFSVMVDVLPVKRSARTMFAFLVVMMLKLSTPTITLLLWAMSVQS